MSAENAPTLEEWRRLYAAAVRVKELGPWQWMTEDQVFGVQDPATGQIGFVSVMGALGEHFAIALYPDARALYAFWDLTRTDEMAAPERLLEIPQLQLSFEDRDLLRDEDRRVIKQLGLKFRGANAWPLFRSYRPGFVPWHLEADEAHALTWALEQTLEVTPRLRDDPALLEMPNNVSYLVRVPLQQQQGVVWEDRIVEVLPPEPASIPIEVDSQALEQLRRTPHRAMTLEIDLIMLPSAVQEERGKRPVFPYQLLVVDSNSGFILGHDLLIARTTLEEMWSRVPMSLIQCLAAAGIMPQQVKVRSPLMLHLLQPLADELHFELKQVSRLRAVNQVRREMARFMGW